MLIIMAHFEYVPLLNYYNFCNESFRNQNFWTLLLFWASVKELKFLQSKFRTHLFLFLFCFLEVCQVEWGKLNKSYEEKINK